jgi:DNA-binding NarL/FixJ family response regulator
MTGGRADECVALAIRALEDGKLIEGTHAGGPTMGAIIILALADRPEAAEFCDQVLAWSHRHGSAFEASGAYLFRGLSRLLVGALAEAQEDLERAFELTTMWGSKAVTLYPAAYLADTLLERGDVAGARASLARATISGGVPGSTNDAWWLAAKLKQLIALGEHEEALQLADEVERRFRDVIVNPAWVPWRSLRAEALHAVGRVDEAIEQAAAEVELARRWGAPRVLGRALRVLGTVSSTDGMAYLEQAVAVLDGSIARLEHAKALAALGAALRRARRPSDARGPLRKALELATACDAAPLVEHARAELHATGARPRTAALRGVAALTASESRVASLAAQGQTNRDIAQALFVTPKTVEVHLSSAYRKLGIGSRRELAAALATT